MRGVLEDLAAEVLCTACATVPIDARRVARSLGLTCIRAPIDTACLVDETVFYPYVRRRRGHGLVAHETAHFLLQAHGLPDTESNADYLGAALLVPLPRLLLDLETVGIDLDELQRVHANASATLLVTRVAEAVGGRATLWRDGELVWSRPTLSRTLPLIAAQVYATGRPLSVDGECYGWPLGGAYVAALDL